MYTYIILTLSIGEVRRSTIDDTITAAHRAFVITYGLRFNGGFGLSPNRDGLGSAQNTLNQRARAVQPIPRNPGNSPDSSGIRGVSDGIHHESQGFSVWAGLTRPVDLTDFVSVWAQPKPPIKAKAVRNHERAMRRRHRIVDRRSAYFSIERKYDVRTRVFLSFRI